MSLLFLAVASPSIVVLFLMPWPFAEVIFSVLVMGFPVALMVVGVARSEKLGGVGIPFLVLLIVLQACALGMLALRGHVLDAPWIGGLPLSAAIQLYGLLLVPLLLVPLTYALTFDRFELKSEDIEELNRLKRESTGEES